MATQTVVTIIGILINLLVVVGGVVFFFGGEKRGGQHLDATVRKLGEELSKKFDQLERKVDDRFSKLDEINNRSSSRFQRLLKQFVELRTHLIIMNQKAGNPPLQLLENQENENDAS